MNPRARRHRRHRRVERRAWLYLLRESGKWGLQLECVEVWIVERAKGAHPFVAANRALFAWDI